MVEIQASREVKRGEDGAGQVLYGLPESDPNPSGMKLFSDFPATERMGLVGQWKGNFSPLKGLRSRGGLARLAMNVRSKHPDPLTRVIETRLKQWTHNNSRKASADSLSHPRGIISNIGV